MAADAFDELAKAKMGVDGGVQAMREGRAVLGLTAQHFVEDNSFYGNNHTKRKRDIRAYQVFTGTPTASSPFTNL